MGCACAFSQSCPTRCDPRHCSPPGSSVHMVLQARVLEWGATPSYKGSSPPRDRTRASCFSCIGRRILYHWASWGSPKSRISTLIKEPPEVRIQEGGMGPDQTLNLRHLDLKTPATRTVRNKCLWFLSPLIHIILLWQPRLDWDTMRVKLPWGEGWDWVSWFKERREILKNKRETHMELAGKCLAKWRRGIGLSPTITV